MIIIYPGWLANELLMHCGCDARPIERPATVIYVFESETREGLFAFAGEPSGTHLPERHGPWRATGSEPRLSRIDRSAIDAAVKKVGFQLWRKRAASEE